MARDELVLPMDKHQLVNKSALKVLIVDDEVVNRIGLRYLLTSVPEVEVIAEAGSGAEAIKKTQQYSPDIILMDVTMPELDGIATTRAIRRSNPGTKILILTSVTGSAQVSRALEAGAHGYCLKDSSPEEFLNALKVVRDGNIFLDAKVMPSLINSFNAKAEKNASCSQKTDAYAALSDRELEILSMKMRGVKDDEAAKSLNVSLETLQRLELEIKEKMFDLESRPISKRQTSSQSHVRFCETCESVYEPNIEVCPNDGSTLFDEQTSRWLGTILDGKYELLGFLGKGGGASVFKGNHHYLNQQVAIKIIHGEHSTDFTMLKRFRGEAEIASRLNHPNIVQVYDFGVVDSGTPYLVMEYLEGINLANRLRKINYMSPAEMLTIFWQTCSALEYAHQNKVVHRDVKPSNIFLAERSNGEQIVKLLDFGLAKSIEKQTASNALTAHGQIVGTPDYMSPESCRDGIYTQPSDIYSLGCTMFECLSGAPPFKGDTIVEVMYKHIHDPAPTLFTHSNATPLETSLAKIIAKCLEKNPNRRYNDATEIKNELLELPFTG